MKRLTALLLASVLTLSLSACGAAGGTSQTGGETASDLEYIQEKGKLVVGITDFAPMDYNEGGEWIGFDADMAKAFAESIGVEAEFIEIDWDSKTMELDNKNIDCVWNGMTLTDGVKKAMEVSRAYCNNQQMVVVPADMAAAINSKEDIMELTVAVEAGSAGAQVAAELGLDATEVQTQADAVMETAAGTAQACIIDSLMAAAMVGEGTSYENLAYTIGLTDEEYVVGFRKGSDAAEKLNEFFKTTYDDGSMLSIAEKYGTQASIIAQ